VGTLCPPRLPENVTPDTKFLLLLGVEDYVSTLSAISLHNDNFQEVLFFVTIQPAFTSKCWPSKYDR
jgi:hypothetical protein